jgi:hypothetical protein
MTTQTPVLVLMEAADLGLKLGVKAPDKLVVDASKPWPKEFADTLAQHKTRLLELLQLPFVIADSKILDETIFFCEDEQTRDALVEAGADMGAIYTRDELKILLEQNRAKPFTAAELRKLHEIKRTFGAKSHETN